MRSSPNLTIPEGGLWAQVNVNVDQYWLTEIKERKFTKENTLEEFLKIIEEINTLKFPVHHRRVTMLEAKQKGDPLEFVRELIELARSAEWGTFSEESAICHLFLNNVKCDEAKKLCFKILRKNLDGDTKKLIAEL